MLPEGSDVQFVLTCDWSVFSHSTVYGSGACVNLVESFLLSFKFCIFAANYFSCSRTCRVLVSFDSKHLVSAMRQRRDISSIAWISANGNALLIYRRKFVAPVLLRYSVVKTGHITFHSNAHQQSGCMFCKTAVQETPWGKNWLLKTMAETENRGKL